MTEPPVWPPPAIHTNPPQWAPPTPYAVAPPPAPPAPVDGFAITSLVFGIFGGVLLSVGFGIAALRRIGRGERRGKGLAIAGLSLSLVWVIALVGLLGYAEGRHPSRNSAGAVTRAGQVSPTQLQVGDCIEVPPAIGTVASMRIGPCTQPHNGQVYALVRSGDYTVFPGQQFLENEGLQQCRAAVADFVDVQHSPLHIIAFVPTPELWGRGDRIETCVLVDRAKDFTGDVRTDA